MRDAVIVEAVRSPITRAHKGALVDVRPDDLLAAVIREVVRAHPDLEVDEVICGCGYPWGEQGFNIARAATVLAQLPIDVPAYIVSRMCASSLQAIRLAGHMIAVGEGDVVIACGVESVSRVGRDRHLAPVNTRLTAAGIADLEMSMVMTAERVAQQCGVTRAEMDSFAQSSHERALAAQADGFFAREILSIELPTGEVLAADDGPRKDSSLGRLSELEPVSGEDGRITAGNACPLNDGAAAVLLMSMERCRELGLKPRARIVASGVSALDPTVMGLGPIEAVGRALRGAGLTIDELDAIEVNEAFAAQVIPCATKLGVDPQDDRLNARGGAIALGHPFGMTGARIMCTLLNRLDECDGEFGLETMCVGGGQGQAMVVQRLTA